MSIRKGGQSKIVKRYVGETYFDVRLVFKHKGDATNRIVESSSYGVYHSKHQLKSGFKNADDAENFAINIFSSYDKKTRKFSEHKISSK